MIDQDLRDKIIETHTWIKDLRKDVGDHEDRLRLVEKRQSKIIYYSMGVAATLGTGVSTVWNKLFHGGA